MPLFPSVLEGLRKKRFTLGRTDATSRVVNLWESEGVVEDPRNEGQGWRRYSLIDLVWLASIHELRTFGVPIETLRKAKDNLLGKEYPMAEEYLKEDPNAPQPAVPNLFEYYVLQAIQRTPVYLLVFADGDVEVATEHEYNTAPLISPLANHLRLSVNALVGKAAPALKHPPKYSPGVNPSAQELSILVAARNPEVRRLTVRFKNGEPDLLETERDALGKTVQQLMKEVQHGELTVKQQDGETVHLSQLLKQKL